MSEINGWLVLDKPLGITSRAAVDWSVRWFPKKTPLGHTGTLDPLATGILVLAVGRATRLAEYVQRCDKVYESVFTLGSTSATDDSEGPIVETTEATDPGRDRIESTLATFVGSINQVPPAFSAIKIGGKRAYKFARAGRPVAISTRTVRVDRITLLNYRYPRLHVRIRCGQGTFIRSLARDVGERLGCGAYVSELRRLSVGSFNADDVTPWNVESPILLPLDRGVGELKWETIPKPDVSRFRHGQTIIAPEQATPDDELACFDDTGRLVAVARVLPNSRLQPVKVMWRWTEED